MTWHYQGSEWLPPEDFNHKDVYGFVYLITNLATSQKYVGKKFFWSQKTLGITKTRKRRKKTLVESDWQTYWGSNKHLQEHHEKIGDRINPNPSLRDTHIVSTILSAKNTGEIYNKLPIPLIDVNVN